MPSIYDYLHAYSVIEDFGADPTFSVGSARRINIGLANLAARSPAASLVFVPPGTYMIEEALVIPANVMMMGMGDLSILKLAPEALVDVITAVSADNIRLKDLVVDGDRANQTGGTRHGVYLWNCHDCRLDNVVAKRAAYHGIRLEQCDRAHLKGCVAQDCGYDGISLDYCFYTQLVGCRALDNSKSGAGNGNGVTIGLLSTNTMISDIESRETSGSGTYQGWGVREVPAQNVGLTLVAGYSMAGNVSGVTSFESADSGRWPT